MNVAAYEVKVIGEFQAAGLDDVVAREGQAEVGAGRADFPREADDPEEDDEVGRLVRRVENGGKVILVTALIVHSDSKVGKGL